MQTSETIKLFGGTKKKKAKKKKKKGENVPSLEVVAVDVVQYNLEENYYQQKYEVLYTFTPNKCYAYL